MTVVYGARYGIGSAGWTQVTQDSGTGDRIYYVSSSVGNDSFNGLAGAFDGVNGPKATIAAGVGLLRNGTGDWLLLKSGDTWTDQGFGAVNFHGRSTQQPIMFSSYGSGARPVLKYSGSIPLGSPIWLGQGYSSDNIAVIGLDFYGYTVDPNSGSFNGPNNPGIAIQIQAIGTTRPSGTANNWLIEDCLFRYVYAGISFDKGGPADPNPSGWIVRRNIFRDLLYPYGIFTSSQAEGCYMGNMENLTLEENVWSNIGSSAVPWVTGTATVTAGSPAVCTWSQAGLANLAPIIFSGTLPSGLVAGATYAINNISGTSPNFSFNIQSWPDGNFVNLASGGSVSIAWQSFRTFYAHGNYIQGDQVVNPPSIQGNIYGNDCGPQHRAGGTLAGNFFFGCNEGSAWQNLNPVTLHNNVTDNVWSEPVATVGLAPGEGIGQAVMFVNNEGVLNLGAAGSFTTYQNNIFTHNRTCTTGWAGIDMIQGCNGQIVQNNIFWDWSISDSNAQIMDRNFGTIFSFKNLVGGSGYTPASGTQQYNAVMLTGGTPDSGPSGFDGIPRIGAVATAITVTNGTVSSVTNWPNQNDAAGGNGYAVNQILSANASDIGGTGSGFNIVVGALCMNNVATSTAAPSGTNNVFHLNNDRFNPDVSAFYPDPTRSITTYVVNVLGLPDAGNPIANYNQFIAGAVANSKSGSLANPTNYYNYTANGFVNYIRAGFNLPPLGTLSLSPTTLPNGFVGVTYSQQIVASGGSPPYSYAITAGALPNGMTMGTNGVIYGAAVAAGTFSFTVTATDSAGVKAPQAYTISPVINIVMSPSGAPTVFTANVLGHR